MSDDESKYFKNSLMIMAALGAGIGVLLSVLTVQLLGRMEGPSPFEQLGGDVVRGPGLLCGIASLGFGWVLSWIAERRGFTSTLPIALSAIVAFVVCWVGTFTYYGRPPIQITIIFAVGAVCIIAAGWLRNQFVQG
jgi:membrane-bound metal-dependent hydrolase YbcI (DUF457 family)